MIRSLCRLFDPYLSGYYAWMRELKCARQRKDDDNRDGLGIEVDTSLTSSKVVRALEQIIEWRGKPAALRCDHGPDYLSQMLVDWVNEHHGTLLYMQPGKPTQNATIKRFNRTATHKRLDMRQFNGIAQTQRLASLWLWQYDNEDPRLPLTVGRPDSKWGGLIRYLKMR